MIRYLGLRMVASMITIAAVIPSHSCRAAQTPVLDGAIVQLDHISVRAVGHGSPVILIPGLSSTRDTWNTVLPELAKTHRVHLVELNGFGGTAPGANLAPGMLDGVVADLDRYIGQNKLAGAAVVGHSLGGTVTLMLAKAHPGDIGKAMLIDAIPFTADIFAPGVKLTADMVRPRASQIRDQMAAAYGKPADPAGVAKIAANQAIMPAAQARVGAMIATADPRVTAEAFYEDATTDLHGSMASIETPLTLVYPWSGTSGQAQTDAFYRAEYAGTPHISFVPIAQSGHFIMLDQPVAFASALHAFLAS